MSDIETNEHEAIESNMSDTDEHEAIAEEWKPVSDYPYEVSNTGKVRRAGSAEPLKPRPNNKGYLQVQLYRSGKPKDMFIHRLVALAFIPNPENKPEVDHLDRVKTHNCSSNLRWATRAENNQNNNGEHVSSWSNWKTGTPYWRFEIMFNGRKYTRVFRKDLFSKEEVLAQRPQLILDAKLKHQKYLESQK